MQFFWDEGFANFWRCSQPNFFFKSDQTFSKMRQHLWHRISKTHLLHILPSLSIYYLFFFPKDPFHLLSLLMLHCCCTVGGLTTAKLQSGQASYDSTQPSHAPMRSLRGVWDFGFRETTSTCLAYRAPDEPPLAMCLAYRAHYWRHQMKCSSANIVQALTDLKVSQVNLWTAYIK